MLMCYRAPVQNHFWKPSSRENMRLTSDQHLKWELCRERFRLEELSPPSDRRPERCIGDILAGILKKEDAETGALPEKIAERWPVIAGEHLAKHTRPAYVKKGILYVHADHPGWLVELRRLPKAHMLKKISSVRDIYGIKDIRFQLDPAIRTSRK